MWQLKNHHNEYAIFNNYLIKHAFYMHIYCVYSPFRSNFSTVKCLVSIGDHGLQEPLSSGLKVLSPADQQVQSCPVSPASAHSSIVDFTTEGEFTAITPNITHTAVNA